jgi:hypothetical protein
MTYRIDPDDYCTEDGCKRPKATGEQVCSQCLRLAGATAPDRGTADTSSAAISPRELKPEIQEFLADEPKPPRCVAYLSMAGDVITLELTGDPRFTEADVEAVAAALSNLRKAA